jgi:diguanylate cyclase (GGDEF)-like protein/putative nucleotidyltransferase with HDIG domain
MHSLPTKAKVFLISTIAAGAAIFAGLLLQGKIRDPWTVLALTLAASLSLIFKVEGATNRSHYNISFLVYGFSFFVLDLPDAAAVILVSNLIEWAWRKYPWYIQSFNISSYLVALQFSAVVRGFIAPTESLTETAAILLTMAAFTFVNHAYVGLIVWLARGESLKQSGVFNVFPLLLDFILLVMGAGAAIVWNVNPSAVVLSLLPLYLIYTTLRMPALERQTESDVKTGLFNARFFMRSLETELERCHRYNRPLTVVMADLDLLRNINNTYGHLAGDEVLIGIAKILKQSMREIDIVARFGGEEFAILMPECTPEDVYDRIDAIRQVIETAAFSVPTSVTPIKATISMGIAGREAPHQQPVDIIHNADTALYHAKLTGRNRTCVYSQESFNNFFPPASAYKTYELAPLESTSRSGAGANGGRAHEPFKRKTAQHTGQNRENESPSRQPTQPTPRPRKPLVMGLIVGLVLIAAVLTVASLILQLQPPVHWQGLAVFLMAVVIAEWVSIDIYARDTSVSTSAVPILAGVLLFGPVGVITLSAAFAMVAMLKHQSKASRFVFNASNQIVAGMIYCLPLLAAGLIYADLPVLQQLVVGVIAAMVVFLVTTSCIALAMSLDGRLSFRRIWKEQFSWLAPYYLAMGVVAFGLVLGYLRIGLMGVAVVLVPLLIFRLSQKQFIHRTQQAVQELRASNAILQENSQEINKLNNALLDTLAEVIDIRSPSVSGHSKQVARYAVMIAEKMGLTEAHVERVRKAGLLHDIGKLGIPDAILLKPGQLTPQEADRIRTHSTIGANILDTSHALRALIPVVRNHHERYDGSGYPDRLSNESIAIEARIVAVADAFEAMASDRPYRKALALPQIIEELRRCAGTQFDPVVVAALVDILRSNGHGLVVNSGLRAVEERELARI